MAGLIRGNQVNVPGVTIGGGTDGTGAEFLGTVGPTGPAGPQGTKGDTGAAGAAGSQGPQGVAGANGTSVFTQIAASDELTSLTTGTKITFRAAYAFNLTSVKASLTTACTGSALLINITRGGISIFSSSSLTIPAGSKTSVGGSMHVMISNPLSVADDDEFVVSVTQVGSTIAGAGLKVTFVGNK